MSVGGDRAVFAFEIRPLAGAPPEGDPSAAVTWAELQIWLHGENLTRHVHTDQARVDNGIHWPVVYLARWFVRSWPELFEAQRWPVPGLRNTRDVCNQLDEELVDLEGIAELGRLEELAVRRDTFVLTHALAAGAAGGLVPDLYLGRDGGRISVALGAGLAHPSVRFYYERSERDVAVPVFLDAVRGLVTWVLERVGPLDGAIPSADKEAFSGWLSALGSPSAAEAAVLGYAGVDKESLLAAYAEAGRGGDEQDVLGSVFELEPGWQRHGAQLDGQSSGAAIVFRALLPTMSVGEVLGVLDTLRASPANPGADEALRALQKSLPSVSVRETDYWQGYHLAEAVRAYLGNPDSRLEIEGLLNGIGIRVADVELEDAEVDGGAVWDDHHGPVLLVNQCSIRARTRWGRRMVLAHELCHLLIDRSAAIPLKIMSGPWAPPVLERRANAFAAELLLPRAGVISLLGMPRALPGVDGSKMLMKKFGVGIETCTWHIKNRFRLSEEPYPAAARLPSRSPRAPEIATAGSRSAARGFKELLLSLPNVGEDADFERPLDFGRPDESWDS